MNQQRLEVVASGFITGFSRRSPFWVFFIVTRLARWAYLPQVITNLGGYLLGAANFVEFVVWVFG